MSLEDLLSTKEFIIFMGAVGLYVMCCILAAHFEKKRWRNSDIRRANTKGQKHKNLVHMDDILDKYKKGKGGK